MPSAAIKVLVVDDSPFVRELLEKGLSADGDIQVVGTAADAFEAGERIPALRPDVLTLDVEMPRMNGIEFLRRLMPQYPLPVVMVSALTERGCRLTLDALALGAVDFVTKPRGDHPQALESMLDELAAKIRVAASANLSRLWRQAESALHAGSGSSTTPTPPIPPPSRLSPHRVGTAGDPAAPAPPTRALPAPGRDPARLKTRHPGNEMVLPPFRRVAKEPSAPPLPAASRPPEPRPGPAEARPETPSRVVVAIGASTGGSEALKVILPQLPARMPGVLVVQHMPSGFTRLFAERLDMHCAMRVKEAAEGDLVSRGCVLIAPGGSQMKLMPDASGGWRVSVRDKAPVNGHVPSVDVLFRSVAQYFAPKAVAVMLTGMGADGADAMKVLRDRGSRCFAQDQATSVVFGMPQEAFKRGGAERLVPLPDIPGAILDALRRMGEKVD